MEYVNKITLKQKVKSYLSHPFSAFLLLIVVLSTVFTIGIMVVLVGYILISGVPNLKLSLFEWDYTSENVSMLPAIVNTITMTVLTLVFAVPIGIGSAIYLNEYAKRGNKLVKIVRLTTETLSGIPSIVYGLFGYLMFNIACGLGYSMIGGALTLAIMILPLIMRTTEEALKSVPDLFREGSFGLGAGKVRTIFRIILPSAMPGILAGIILAIGRIIGETAALIYTAGTIAGIPQGLTDSGRTLSIHLYSLLSEGLHTEEAKATAVVILIVVVGLNGLSSFIAKKIAKK